MSSRDWRHHSICIWQSWRNSNIRLVPVSALKNEWLQAMEGWDLVCGCDLWLCLHPGHVLLMAVWRDVQVCIKQYDKEQAWRMEPSVCVSSTFLPVTCPPKSETAVYYVTFPFVPFNVTCSFDQGGEGLRKVVWDPSGTCESLTEQTARETKQSSWVVLGAATFGTNPGQNIPMWEKEGRGLSWGDI